MKMIYQILALLAVHWIADFVLQTHWQATNKSKRNDALFIHVFNYSACLLVAAPFIFHNDHYEQWLIFIAINAILHFITDYFTSRLSSKLYAKQDFHNFFVVIGFDQLIHQITLSVTMIWIF